jgi:hypothetical protein
MKKIVAGAILLLTSPLVMANYLRCGSRIIGPGSSSAELAALCGDPAQINKSSVSSAEGVSESDVETWTYNFGPNQLMERVRIKDGVIIQIDSLGYGYNEP